MASGERVVSRVPYYPDVKKMVDGYNYLKFLYGVTHMDEYCEHLPHQFFVEPTNKCNCRCEFCIQTKMKRKKGLMDFELMKKIIDEVAFFNPYFDFCRQGEPLLHPQLVDMLEYATKAGLTKTRLITNGTLLSPDIARRIIGSGLNKINISFNGYDKASYEKMQKGAKFEKVLANIFELLRLKHDMGSEKPSVEISLVKYEELADKCDEFVAFFQRLPVDRIRVSNMIDFFGKNPDEQLKENVKRPWEEWPSCKVPFRFMNINWSGDVTPCIIDYDDKYTVGNVNKGNVLDVWNNEKYRFLRKCHIQKRFDLIVSQNGDFCNYCNNLWKDPGDNGPQYPESFEQGVRDFFEQKKTQAGRFEDDLFKSKDDLAEQYEHFVGNYDKLYDELVSKAT